MPEHTIAENLTRLQNATTAIGNAITNAGGTVTQGDGLEEFSTDVGTIVPPINTVVEAANTSIEASLGSGGTPITLIEKTVMSNATYNASDDNADGYSKVVVNIPQSGVELYQCTVTSTTMDSSDFYIFNFNNKTYVMGTFKTRYGASWLDVTYPEAFTPIATSELSDYLYGQTDANASQRFVHVQNFDTTNRSFRLTFSSAFTAKNSSFMIILANQ